VTVIAWDGKTLAADRQATRQGTVHAVRKLHRVRHYICGICGSADVGFALLEWLEHKGSPVDDRREWPAQQATDEWAVLVVVDTRTRKMVWYGRQPYAHETTSPFIAWGSGRDIATGAMACGKSAVEAVEIACQFDADCGMGVDSMSLDDDAN
jgi:ATP-dependent protease HslVU (ClpYQ) peptidase subunit